MKIILQNCPSSRSSAERMEYTRQALEQAGHAVLLVTTPIGVPKSVMDGAGLGLSSSRMGAELRKDLGFPIYAGKPGANRDEGFALLEGLGMKVAAVAVVSSGAELEAATSELGSCVILRPQSGNQLADLDFPGWVAMQESVEVREFSVDPKANDLKVVKAGQARYPAVDAPLLAVSDPNPKAGDTIRVLLLFGRVLLVSRTSERPLDERMGQTLKADGTREVAGFLSRTERDANTREVERNENQWPELEALAGKLTGLGYGLVQVDFRELPDGSLVAVDFEDGNRAGGHWANAQPGFLDRFAAAVVAKANEG